MRRILYFIFLIPFFLWGVLSLWYGSWPQPVCMILSVLYGAAHVVTIFAAPLRRVLMFCLAVFFIPLVSFFLMQPSHNRQWQKDVAQMPHAEIDGNRITIHNVRNTHYTSENEFTPRFETNTYDLSQLRSVDLFLTDWGLRHIAHTMISFGFEGDRYLCLSIETRKEVGESYSALKGFFRQYELIYILGDERDLVRLRSNFRQGEDVYLYRLKIASIERAGNAFKAVLHRVNQLHDKAEWYNAMTENCMTSAFRLVKKHAAPGRGKWHWSVILNGHAFRNGYENGVIDTSMPFEELKRISRINDRALASDNTMNFSVNIRKDLPGMAWYPVVDK